jgi:selenide,water dikinase
LITREEAEDMIHAAVCSMARLNRNGGLLMIGAEAHAGTDVTGFGIVGHAQNLVENQAAEDLGMEIHTLPCIAGTAAVNNKVLDFGLLKGTSSETSGGLLICIPQDKAEEYCKKLEELDGCPSWVIGKVVHDPERKAKLVEGFQVIEV